jgi:hypothetical protein
VQVITAMTDIGDPAHSQDRIVSDQLNHPDGNFFGRADLLSGFAQQCRYAIS